MRLLLVILSLGLALSAQAYSGRTTDKTYRTGTLAARHTGAYYMTRAARGGPITHAGALRVIKMGKTPKTTCSSSWVLMNKAASTVVAVKVKKLGAHAWKGYTDGLVRVLPIK